MLIAAQHFGPEWTIEVEPRSHRTWRIRVGNGGGIASSFVPLGFTVLDESDVPVEKLELRTAGRGAGAGSGTLLNPGEHLDYELWIRLKDTDEPGAEETREIALVLSYLELSYSDRSSLVEPLVPERLRLRLSLGANH